MRIMDIIKISMKGYGCDIARGTMSITEHSKVKHLIENVWNKGLYQKLKENTNIKTYSENCGIISGDIKIYVNDELILDSTLSTIDVLGFVETTKEEYPKTDDIVITTVQHQEGTFCDTVFVLDEDFDITKLNLIKKDVVYNVDNPLVSSLYCEMYYDGIEIPLLDSETDLRNSRLYTEILKNKNR